MVKAQIKQANRLSASIEAVEIAGFSPAEADRMFPLPPGASTGGLAIRLRPPTETRVAFLDRFAALMARLDG